MNNKQKPVSAVNQEPPKKPLINEDWLAVLIAAALIILASLHFIGGTGIPVKF